jgi:TatA/E family protein of Tat protein translocase
MPFGITPLHVILVLVIALIVLGPGRLPKVGSAVGKTIREFRGAVPATRDAFVSEVGAGPDIGAAGGAGAAVGSKMGTLAGRSVVELRSAVSGARDGFQAEVAPASSAVARTSRTATGAGEPDRDRAV